MRRTAIALGVAGLLAIGSTPASAEVPPINCGIVSCTYQVEQAVEGAQECVDGAKRAVRYMLQGTPQPQECSLR